LRALKGVHDGDPAGQVWAEYMANTLLIAKQMMHQAAIAGHTHLSQDQAGSSVARMPGRSLPAVRPTPASPDPPSSTGIRSRECERTRRPHRGHRQDAY